MKTAWNAQKLEGNSKLMALLKDLEKEGFYYRIKKEGEEDSDDEEIESSRTVSSTNILTHLYIAHPQSIEMYKNNHELLLLDCNYRTNRFSMPCLNFCGKTGNNSTLQICLAFLPDEKIPAYEWALRTHGRLLVAFAIPAPLTIVTDKEDALLNSLNRYFPSSTHLLCRWHVNKNIVKNTRDKYFELGEEYVDRNNVRKNRRHELWIKFWDLWEAILNSKSQEEYEENVQNLRACKVREEAIRYCESWLLYKEKLVICQCVFLLL